MESDFSTLSHSHSQKLQLRNSFSGATDANLTSAIKKGTVKSFLRQGVGSIGEGGAGDNQQNMGLEGHLLQLKNSCCDLSKEIKNKQMETFKCKDSTQFTLDKGKKLKEQRNQLESKMDQLQRSLVQIASKRDSASHCSKTYEHILERMKKDSILSQLRKNQLARELKNLQKNLNMIEAKKYNLTELEKLSVFGVKDAHSEFGQQKLTRKHKLTCIEEQTSKKKQLAEKLKQRQSQTDQIQQMAAGDLQDADLMRLKKFLNVQIFLKELLKSKIARLKKYYEPFQITFYQIKSRTHVRDSNSLKNQFFNFQHIYNEKTEWVKVLEDEVSEAQQQRLNLKQKLKELMNKEIQILEALQAREQIKVQTLDRHEIAERSAHYELSCERIKSWIVFQAKKMNLSLEQTKGKYGELLKLICAKAGKRAEPKEQQKSVEAYYQQPLELLQVGTTEETY